MLAQPRMADAVLICTPDRMHYKEAMTALEKDYHVLLEKPIAQTAQECRDIERLAEEKGRQVIVCHVLRYTPFYQTIKKVIDEGTIGEIQSVQAIERVAYWHQAHSFVRGNWGNSDKSSPMILQKSCHDMDILLWLCGKSCRSVTSFGSLGHFDAAHAPKGSPDRCTEGCPAADKCPYNAEKYYMSKLREGKTGWPVNVLTSYPTEESVMKALREGPYGRCVYHCDNNVVDHQVVNLLLADGVTVSFTMCAFTADTGREIRLMGTKGEIFGDMSRECIRVMPFGEKETVIDLNAELESFAGHGGGDERLMRAFLELLRDGQTKETGITRVGVSVESHLAAFAAEKSRLEGGKIQEI